MSALVLVDSSFYIRQLTERRDPFRELDLLADDYDYAICGIVWMEVVRGRSDVAVRTSFQERFREMIFLNLTPRARKKAAELTWVLDRQGAVLPATDFAIAACALEAGATVLTLDKHFWKVPQLTVTDFLL